MKKTIIIGLALVSLSVAAFVFRGPIVEVGAEIKTYFGDDDPDLPSKFMRGMTEQEYIAARNAALMQRLGETPGVLYDPAIRDQAIATMRKQEMKLEQNVANGIAAPQIGATWAPVGPYPIPNGQTSNRTDPVSGRTTAIAIHPTNANIVYAGTAQGGVYRTLDGGVTWTQLFNNANSQVIGAVAISPSNPDIVYVGTGEANLCGSGCYAGIGVYRIDNASTTADLTGPINPLRNYNDASSNPVSSNIFTGRAISKILVNPTDPSIIFVSTASAIVGKDNQSPFGGAAPPLGLRGVYRLNNATGSAASVTFTKLTVNAVNCFDNPCTGNQSVMDMAFDGNDATGNTLVCWARPALAVSDGGVFRTTTANTTATFTQRLTGVDGGNTHAVFSGVTIAGTTTMYLASAEASTGRLRKSTDGGQTWGAALAGASGYCGGQCFYDIGLAIDPTNPNTAYVGGATGNGIFEKTTDGFATANGSVTGLHADTHAIAVAPSNPSVVYFGSDGGIWKSVDAGATWTSLNNSGYSATQFESLATHPTDPWFSIGGTQDNGTNFLQPNAPSLPNAGWTRADFGDGGYARIDQTATNTTNVVMYHTYFNQTNNLIGFARTTTSPCATEGQWSFRGIYGGGVDPTVHCDGNTDVFNGITIADAVNFYAPLELGPSPGAGLPQTVYFGTDRLYRSVNRGDTMTVVSSAAPGAIVAGQTISAIGIAASDDNYRFVGLGNGQVWGSTSGLPPFTNVSPPVTAARVVEKVAIDPNNKNTAFVAYGGQFGTAAPATQHIWKTVNLNSATPTWTSVGNGIPDSPVNSLLIDPKNSSFIYAATDIGVYVSVDAGLTWGPMGTGLPKIAVFDMAVAKGGNAEGTLRIATHGRGLWQVPMILTPTAATVAVSGRVLSSGGVGVRGALVSITDTHGIQHSVMTNAFGYYTFNNVQSGENFVMRASARGYAFTPKTLSITDSLGDVDFVSGQ